MLIYLPLNNFWNSSGDTGVSASVVLHGTPPFSVYYRTQRDNESPRDLMATFPNSRGELTLQPERSGHYVYTFLSMSDSNYKKVELNGPSIDQIVHPLAAAEFVNAGQGARSKRMVNSCSGNMVDVEVDLRVSQKISGYAGCSLILLQGNRAVEFGSASSGSKEIGDLTDSWDQDAPSQIASTYTTCH